MTSPVATTLHSGGVEEEGEEEFLDEELEVGEVVEPEVKHM